MAHPKRKTSQSKSRMGRSHHALKPKTIHECPNCGSPVLPHRICSSCGHYKGMTIVAITTEQANSE